MLAAGTPAIAGAWFPVGVGLGVGVGVGDGLGEGVPGIVEIGVLASDVAPEAGPAPVEACASVAFALDASPPPPPHAASDALSRIRLVRWTAWRVMIVCMFSVPRFEGLRGKHMQEVA
jgi:hypothetical protein